MAKKVAVIGDLSGFGKCSLTAAIPVLSVMGMQACPLPTAILSSQTEFPSYYFDDYTEHMDCFRQEWKKLGVSFDGIYTGFISSEVQIDHIIRFLDDFRTEDTFLLVDPVMGDDGITYDVFTKPLLLKMKKLIKKADFLTPNLTELCLLTGEFYEDICKMEQEARLSYVELLAKRLLQGGGKAVVVTGLFRKDPIHGERIGNLLVTGEETVFFDFAKIGGSFSGTGDLFASVLAGGIARGDDLKELCTLAGTFIEAAMSDAVREGNDSNHGSEFEQHLGLLLPKGGDRHET